MKGFGKPKSIKEVIQSWVNGDRSHSWGSVCFTDGHDIFSERTKIGTTIGDRKVVLDYSDDNEYHLLSKKNIRHQSMLFSQADSVKKVSRKN